MNSLVNLPQQVLFVLCTVLPSIFLKLLAIFTDNSRQGTQFCTALYYCTTHVLDGSALDHAAPHLLTPDVSVHPVRDEQRGGRDRGGRRRRQQRHQQGKGKGRRHFSARQFAHTATRQLCIHTH